MTTEEWRPIPGASNYLVSDLGRVFSIPRLRTRGGLKAIHPRRKGYLAVSLHDDNGRQVTRDVHRLVALAFLGPCPSGLEVRHLNGDRSDARLVNLAYGTASENAQDALRHGTHAQASKTHCLRGHPFNEENTYVQPTKRGRWCRACARLRVGERPRPGEHNRIKSHCPQGHTYTPENIYRPPGDPNARHCRRCKAERSAEAHRKRCEAATRTRA